MIKSIKQFKEKLYFIITNKDKIDIRNVLFFGFIIGLFELVGLTLIVAMIQIFTNFSIVESNTILNYIFVNFASNKVISFVLLVSLVISVFYTIKLILSIWNAKLMAKLAANLYLNISKKLFENYLNYYYRDFAKKNTAEINQMLILESDSLALMVSNIIYLIIHTVILCLLYAYMVYIDYILTSFVTIFILFLAILYKKSLNQKLVLMGEDRIKALRVYMKLIKSSFNNYKFIKSLDGNYISTNLEKSTNNFKKARVNMLYWSEVPKLILEFSVIIIMISILLFIKLKYDSSEQLLVVVSAYALTLFRMLPSLSRILNSVNMISQYKKTLDMVHLEFKYKSEPIVKYFKINFNNSIDINKICFLYPDAENESLKDVSLTIPKGEKLAIIGESGSGKSTLMDIIIGFHLPTKGLVSIDNLTLNDKNISNWRRNISFVPQKVILFESSIKENITFGKAYNEKLFKQVLEDVYMYDVVMEKGGAEAKVGDEVSGFSGGQMQRLAIARALYQEKEILFLDESTSSLDEELELEIIDNIINKYQDKTIIAIVHKKSISKKFDRIIQIDNGKIVEEI